MVSVELSKETELLSRVALFSVVKEDAEALKTLSGIMVRRKLPAGHVLITEGEIGTEFFILISGKVSIHKRTIEDEPFKVAILSSQSTPGLGEAALIGDEQRSATIICEEPCEFFVLKRDCFFKFCDDFPRWAIPILRRIASQLISRLGQANQDNMLLHKALIHEIRGT